MRMRFEKRHTRRRRRRRWRCRSLSGSCSWGMRSRFRIIARTCSSSTTWRGPSSEKVVVFFSSADSAEYLGRQFEEIFWKNRHERRAAADTDRPLMNVSLQRRLHCEKRIMNSITATREPRRHICKLRHILHEVTMWCLGLEDERGRCWSSRPGGWLLKKM